MKKKSFCPLNVFQSTDCNTLIFPPLRIEISKTSSLFVYTPPTTLILSVNRYSTTKAGKLRLFSIMKPSINNHKTPHLPSARKKGRFGLIERKGFSTFSPSRLKTNFPWWQLHRKIQNGVQLFRRKNNV